MINKKILLLLGIVPASLACNDSTTFTFGTYDYQGTTTTRNCAWITQNAVKVSIRRANWCIDQTHAYGSDVAGNCPVACDMCPPTTAAPTGPTASPTRPPSPAPSPFPTSRPSKTPSEHPSDVPSKEPSDVPSKEPSAVPSDVPSAVPSDVPSLEPSAVPSDLPSLTPSQVPSDAPSAVPSVLPSSEPSKYPSLEPSAVPSDVPSKEPSQYPSLEPSAVPSGTPTNNPTSSIKPSPQPSAAPVAAPVAVSPTPSASTPCVDTALRLQIDDNGDTKIRACSWVANRATNWRCNNLPGVAEACPVTCGTCSTCADPVNDLRFRFTYNGNEIIRNCDFVGRIASKKTQRCAASSNICRSTCGVC